MGSIIGAPNGMSFVAAAPCAVSGCSTGGTSPQDLEKIPQSATPSDAVVLSSAAIQLQQADGIFGQPSASQNYSFQTPGLAGSAAATGRLVKRSRKRYAGPTCHHCRAGAGP
jgi:hypothetical protein